MRDVLARMDFIAQPICAPLNMNYAGALQGGEGERQRRAL
jgi:hypothetical protein